MREVCGLDYFGADDAAKDSGGFVDFLKKEGPTLLSDVADGVKSAVSSDKTKVDDKTKGKGGKLDKSAASSGGSWLSTPQLGPIPGGGVLALGALVLGALGIGVYKIAH